VGLGDIDQGVAALQIPMMFDSYEELDYVRDRVSQKLEKRMEQQGYLVLYWGDAGWVQFFSTKKVSNLADLRKLRLFTWGGDPTEERLWTTNGFHVVPLTAVDIPFQLRTNGIDAVPTTALYAETSGIYAWTHYMCDVKWAPLVGATVIAKDVWAKIPADQQAQMLASARKWGAALKDDVRSQGDRAIATMQKGIPGKRASALEVVHIEGAALAEWKATTEKIWGDMKGKMVPAELFDEVHRLRDEYRATAKKGAAPLAKGVQSGKGGSQ
jgi:TRAP-type C4-dicarboxylate transport system substrate-binding protein